MLIAIIIFFGLTLLTIYFAEMIGRWSYNRYGVHISAFGLFGVMWIVEILVLVKILYRLHLINF